MAPDMTPTQLKRHAWLRPAKRPRCFYCDTLTGANPRLHGRYVECDPCRDFRLTRRGRAA